MYFVVGVDVAGSLVSLPATMKVVAVSPSSRCVIL
jgi:hypothetical protein